MNEELYFCLRLTENEHSIVEGMIEDICFSNILQLKYYRKLKEGHVPLIREVKIVGPREGINRFKDWARNEYESNYNNPIFQYLIKNPHKMTEEELRKFIYG